MGLGGWGTCALTIVIDAHGPSFRLNLGPCESRSVARRECAPATPLWSFQSVPLLTVFACHAEREGSEEIWAAMFSLMRGTLHEGFRWERAALELRLHHIAEFLTMRPD